jgi:GTP-binding protein Era
MTDAPHPHITHSGFIGLLGRPNVGKSTLLNHVLGQKLVITSPKPQTTRNRVTGVVNRGATQMVFLDTPGVHQGEKLINRYMVHEALSCVPDVDVVLLLVDATAAPTGDDRELASQLLAAPVPLVLGVNKVDVGSTPSDAYAGLHRFRAVHRVSALTGDGVPALLDDLAGLLPEGPEYYPEDMLSDRSERFIAQEFIREKLFELTEEELPYSIAVTVEQWEDRPDRDLVVVHATVHVERASQKGMVIGKRGGLIKEVGLRARQDLEALLGSRVFLDLHVSVDKNWTRDAKALRRYGYEVQR